MSGDVVWFEYCVLKLCVYVRFVVVCMEAGVAVGDACLWWKSLETPKGVQLETVIRTLLVESKGVDVPLNV